MSAKMAFKKTRIKGV